jgi:hypothetical protein
MNKGQQTKVELVARYRARANYEYEQAHGHGGCPPFEVLYIEALKDTERMSAVDLNDELEGWNC